MLQRNLGFLVVCVGWLVPAASAQSQGGGGGFHHGTLTPGAGPPPSAYADAVFGAIVVGEFTGDLGLDAVVMDDGNPALLMSPEVFITNIFNDPIDNDPALTGNDIATYRYAGTTQDVVLLASASGLQKLVYTDPTDAPWEATTLVSNSTPPVTLGASSAWAGARVVRTGALGWTSAMDVAGLASSGNPKKVLTVFGTPTGGFLAGGGIMTGGNAYGLELLDWDGDSIADDELAVLTSLGIEIWGPAAGSFYTGYSWTSSPIVAAVLHEDITDEDPSNEVGGGDRLAFVLTDGDEQYLGIFSRNGVEDPDLLFLGEAGIVGATAADTDGDGDEDLFLTSTVHASFLVLTNLSPATPSPSTPTFVFPDDTETEEVVEAEWVPFGDEERDPTGNAAGLAIGDFDGDTDLDVLAPAQGDGSVDGRVHLVRNTLVDHYEWLPTVTYTVFTLDEYVEPDEGRLTIDFSQPSELLTEEGDLEPRLKITVWRTPDYELFTDSTPMEVTYHDVTTETFTFQTGETTSMYEYSAMHTVVIRQVLCEVDEYDEVTAVVAQKPALILLNASEENYDEITGQPGVEFQLVRGNTKIFADGNVFPDSRTGGGLVIPLPPPPPEPDPEPRPDPVP